MYILRVALTARYLNQVNPVRWTLKREQALAFKNYQEAKDVAADIAADQPLVVLIPERR